jgi:hypothetical protein
MTTIQHREHSVSPTCNFTAVLPPTGPVHNGDNALPAAAVGTAIRLIGAVHEHGPDDVAHILTDLNNQDLLALAVTLAAMVPDDFSPVELLAWNDSRYAPVVSTVHSTQPPLFPAVLVTRQLKPHGTHAAFTLHRKYGEEPCDACWHGEREYQRNRKRNNRADDRRTA